MKADLKGRETDNTSTMVVLLLYLVLVGGSIVSIVPYFWMIASSFKTMGDFFGRIILPPAPTLGNYLDLITKTGYPRWFLNSSIVAVSFTLLSLFLVSLGGYGFAKFDFPLRERLFLILVVSMMIPFYVTVIPVYALLAWIGWVNTYWVLIIPWAANAFGIFFMRQYIESAVPTDLLDSARIDGCSEFGIYYRIVLPLVKPALAAFAVIAFMSSWNDFLWPLVAVTDPSMYVIPVGLASFTGAHQKVQYGYMMAGSFVSTLPIIILYIRMQKYFRAGLTYGAVK